MDSDVCASLKDQERVAKLPIASGVDINRRAHWGRTPLLWATSNGHANIPEGLIGANALVDLRDRTIHIALYVAAGHVHNSIVSLLLACGADPTLLNHFGNTVAAEVAMRRHIAIVQEMFRLQ